MNNRFDAAITINGEAIEDIEQFTYLGSKMNSSVDAKEEIRVRIKVRVRPAKLSQH